MILPGVELEQARKLAERIRNAVEALPLSGIGGVTVSGGWRRSATTIRSKPCSRLRTADCIARRQRAEIPSPRRDSCRPGG